MNPFIVGWGEAAYTSLGFFWMALWAFILGYAISSMIQVFVTEDRMRKYMGKANAKSVFLGTFFGMISSSCSFSALASTKSLFKKGASFVSSIAFLLVTGLLIYFGFIRGKGIKHHKEMAPKSRILELVLKYLAFASYIWLVLGIAFKFLL